MAYWRINTTSARTFAITICLQASGVLCYSRLLGVVAREKSATAPDEAPEPLREPLLPEEEKVDDDAPAAPGPVNVNPAARDAVATRRV